ncbi:serine/threonine-protein kinase [Archangium sp.]|uniref:serine/threonine-protein kinase n=1 Tax=Archangium sp. TaxID=1872627 RepID=UPI002EDA2FF6
MEGRTISGRYRILRKVGHGGMGSVYLAEQPGLGHKVALKFLNPALSQDESIARRFLNEARSYGLVAHPNAVALHDFGQDEEGNLFISMEYVEGQDLKTLLKAVGRLPTGEALDIALQLADVLAHAHWQKVVHRDLKPENVMVHRGLRGYHVKVLDFGIARILADGATRLTDQGVAAGTPRYMAPEQVQGKEVDARADIYALGLVLFEMLTGTTAVNGTTIAEIMHKQFHQPTPALAEVLPELDSPTLNAIIQKATAKAPEARFASMEEFAEALKAAQGSASVSRPVLRLTPTPTPSAETKLADAQAPLFTPIPGPRPLPLLDSEGTDRTVLSQPHPMPKAGSRMPSTAVIVGAVTLLGLGAAVVIRSTGGTPPASQVSAPVAPGLDTPVVPLSAPPAPGTAAPSRAAVPGQGEAQGAGLDGVDDVRRQLLAEEIWTRANAAFLSGDLDTAQAILDTVPGVEKIQPKVVQLREGIAEVSTLLKRGRSQAKAGDCSAAIQTYNALLKRYPHVSEAKTARRECRDMELPGSLE